MKAPIQLGRNEVAAAAPAEFFECRTHDLFRFARCIGLRVVKEIDAGIVCHRHHFDRGIDPGLIVKRYPRAERQLADLDSRFTQMAIFHECSCIEATCSNSRSFEVSLIVACMPVEITNASPAARNCCAW